MRPGDRILSVGEEPDQGEYTPTVIAGTNISAASLIVAHWFRSGKYVHVFASLNVDPTSTGASQVDITLPIPSDFSATSDALGIATAVGEAGAILADTTNNRLSIFFTAVNTALHTLCLSASYKLL